MSGPCRNTTKQRPLKSEREFLRFAFAGQCRLLAERAERQLTIDDRSVENLFRIYESLVIEDLVS